MHSSWGTGDTQNNQQGVFNGLAINYRQGGIMIQIAPDSIGAVSVGTATKESDTHFITSQMLDFKKSIYLF